jgi:hypothetical protein
VHESELKKIEGFEHPCGLLRPSRQRRAIELYAVAGEDLHLPIERRSPAVFGDGDMDDQRRRDHAALDETRRRFRLSASTTVTSTEV